MFTVQTELAVAAGDAQAHDRAVALPHLLMPSPAPLATLAMSPPLRFGKDFFLLWVPDASEHVEAIERAGLYVESDFARTRIRSRNVNELNGLV